MEPQRFRLGNLIEAAHALEDRLTQERFRRGRTARGVADMLDALADCGADGYRPSFRWMNRRMPRSTELASEPLLSKGDDFARNDITSA